MIRRDDRLASMRMAASASAMLEGPGGPDTPRSESAQRWPDLLRKIDDAVVSGEASAMLRAWQTASVAALLDRDWSSMVAVGDAAIRIGRTTGLRFAFSAKARQAYQVALYRAHRAGAADGVLAAAEGFVEIGDRETVEQCLVIAGRLLESRPRRDVAQKVDLLRERLTGRA